MEVKAVETHLVPVVILNICSYKAWPVVEAAVLKDADGVREREREREMRDAKAFHCAN